MVLKSTHTLSAFSNNFAMCEEFRSFAHSLTHSLSYFFHFHPLTSIYYVPIEINGTKQKKKKKENTHAQLTAKKSFLLWTIWINKM